MKKRIKIELHEKHGEILGHVDLPKDGTFTFEAMRLVFDEFCRANNLPRETVMADFYRFCVFDRRD